MRWIVGLGGLLVTLGVFVWILNSAILPYNKAAIDAQQKVTPIMREVGGYDPNTGARIDTTYKVEPQAENGKVVSLLVTALDPNSGMVKVYGLKKDDTIVEISPAHGVMEKVRDIDDPAVALMTAYQNSQPIVVVRNGQRLTITPTPITQQLATQLNAVTGAGSNSASATGGGENSLQKQLNAIDRIPTH